MIKTFKGLLQDDEQNHIRLSTTDGKMGYRITKFTGIPYAPLTLDQENVLKIYKTKQSTVDGVVDFGDDSLLAVCCIKYNDDAAASFGNPQHVIFDQEIFNQDIYITHEDVHAGSRGCNYYIELEQIKLTEQEALVAIVKDLREERDGAQI